MKPTSKLRYYVFTMGGMVNHPTARQLYHTNMGIVLQQWWQDGADDDLVGEWRDVDMEFDVDTNPNKT